ncbi:hypothetical protein A0257_16645 [Hymenobacter psoromatis]|nr:hypothetical protein A0257_16645 [Hymenobacter psoromatis]
MKKIFLFSVLSLVAAGSSAFYPTSANPDGYLMVVGSGQPGTTSSVPKITIIQPDGQQQVQHLPAIKIGAERYSTAAGVALHQAEF